jgi:ABC-type spermidine/putrescine transport system permease subunit II
MDGIGNVRDKQIQSAGLNIPIIKIGAFLCLALVIGLVVVPAVYLVIWALYGTDTVGVLSDTISTTWVTHLLLDDSWQTSLVYSCLIATIVSTLSCIVLTIHFYYMRYTTSLIEGLSFVMILIPIIFPSIIYALALRMLGGAIGLPEVVLLVIGHLVFVIPLQFFVFESAQDGVPKEILYAGSTMGASNVRNILSVFVPLMSRAIWVSFLVGFFFSFDEIIIASFVIDSPMVTVPRRLWDQVPRSMDPSPAVIGSLQLLLLVISGLLGLATRRLYRFLRFIRGGVASERLAP